jgi:hypothetical protein
MVKCYALGARLLARIAHVRQFAGEDDARKDMDCQEGDVMCKAGFEPATTDILDDSRETHALAHTGSMQTGGTCVGSKEETVLVQTARACAVLLSSMSCRLHETTLRDQVAATGQDKSGVRARGLGAGVIARMRMGVEHIAASLLKVLPRVTEDESLCIVHELAMTCTLTGGASPGTAWSQLKNAHGARCKTAFDNRERARLDAYSTQKATSISEVAKALRELNIDAGQSTCGATGHVFDLMVDTGNGQPTVIDIVDESESDGALRRLHAMLVGYPVCCVHVCTTKDRGWLRQNLKVLLGI